MARIAQSIYEMCMGEIKISISSRGDDVRYPYTGDVNLIISSPGTQEAKLVQIVFPDEQIAHGVISIIRSKAELALPLGLKVAIKIRPGRGEEITENGNGGQYPSGYYGIGITDTQVSYRQ